MTNKEAKRIYQSRYYINKREYILGLSNKPRNNLEDKEKEDLDKYINKFRPKTAKMLRNQVVMDRGPKVEYKKEIRQVLISFD